ncbi:MAG: DUF2723 domain-containing protein [Bacteroidota bacterium]|nr:DUF2723 domain-containing protein [Bacteroidota bacterium]
MTAASRQRLLASLGVFALTLVNYVLTLAPSVDFIDAGELAAVAHGWGIAHPTGYPLFTLAAGTWAQLPLGDGIYRLNLLAAVLSAAAAAVTVQMLFVLLGVRSTSVKESAGKKGKKEKKMTAASSGKAATSGNAATSARAASATAAQAGEAAGGDILRLAAAVTGALVLGLSGTFWRTALSVEVYSLHMLMLALLMWSAAVLFFTPQDTPGIFRRRLLLLALLLGLSFANHMSTIFLLPGFAVLLPWRHGRRDGFWKDLLLALPAFFAGLLPYLYLPLRAAADPWLNWGDPVTADALYRHVSGAQYSVWMFSSFDAWKTQFAYAFSAFGRDLVYVGLAAGAIGLAVAWRRSRQLGVYLLLLLLTCLFWAAGYDIHDIDTYFLLGFFVLATGSAFAVAALPRWLGKRQSAMAVTLAASAILVLPLLSNGVRVSQRGNYLVEDYTRNMFASLQEHALVFSFQWDYWVSASYYYQRVEKLRPDVIVLDKELFRRSWYLEQLRNNFPELTALVSDEMARFETELLKFEEGRPYNPTVIEDAFNGLINAMIDRSYNRRPVYLTIEMEKQFGAGYVRVPEGLAFRLYRPQDVPPAEELFFPALRYRPFESEERLVPAIKDMYANMLSNRGIYLHNAGLFEKAGTMFDRALEIVPGSAPIIGWKQRNAAAAATASP